MFGGARFVLGAAAAGYLIVANGVLVVLLYTGWLHGGDYLGLLTVLLVVGLPFLLFSYWYRRRGPSERGGSALP